MALNYGHQLTMAEKQCKLNKRNMGKSHFFRSRCSQQILARKQNNEGEIKQRVIGVGGGKLLLTKIEIKVYFPDFVVVVVFVVFPFDFEYTEISSLCDFSRVTQHIFFPRHSWCAVYPCVRQKFPDFVSQVAEIHCFIQPGCYYVYLKDPRKHLVRKSCQCFVRPIFQLLCVFVRINVLSTSFNITHVTY